MVETPAAPAPAPAPDAPKAPHRDYDVALLTDEEKSFLADDITQPDFYVEGEEPTPAEMEALAKGKPLDAPDPEPAPAPAPAAAAPAPLPAEIDDPALIPPSVPPAPTKTDRTADLAAIETEAEVIATKLADGELSEVEAAKANRALGARQGRIEEEAATYEKAMAAHTAVHKAAQDRADTLWGEACARLAKEAPALLSPENLADFNVIVAKITQDTTGQTYDRILMRARNAYAAQYERPDLATTAAPKAAAPKPGATPAPGSPAATTLAAGAEAFRVQPVPTLARLPSTSEEDTGQSRWDELNKLTGAEYERALGRLTPDEQMDYGKYA